MPLSRLIDLPANIQEAVAVANSASGLLCPKCEGGESHERSLSVTTDGRYVIYRCWRNKCGYRGRAIMGGDEIEVAVEQPRQFKPRRFYAPLWPLSEQEARAIKDKYGLFKSTLDRFMVRSTQDGTGGFYMPVFGPNGEDRGGVARYSKNGAGPKAVSYKTADQPWMAWYADHDMQDDPVIIVEDQLSAMKLWQLGFDAVALLGTALSRDKMEEIAEHGPDWAVLALDNDAFETAIKYVREYASFNLVPLLLLQDIKDMQNEQIVELLEVVGA